MQRYMFMLLGFCAMAVAAVFYLLPSATVRFEGELAMMAPEEALARLNAEERKMAFSDNLILTHATLALYAGDMATAKRALNRLTHVKTLTASVQEDLAEVARIEGNLTTAIRHLQAAYDFAPTPELRERLGLWHRTTRDRAAEIRVLQSVSPKRLSDSEVERLASLLTSTRRLNELEALYRVIAGGETALADRFKERLVDYLVETGRANDAVTAAVDWFEAADHDQLPLDIAVPVLIARGEIGSATELAILAVQYAPQTSHTMILKFTRSGHRAIALDLQRRTLSQRRDISVAHWDSLVEVTELTGDLRGLRVAMAIAGRQAPDQVLIAVLTQFLRYQGAAALTPYRAYLTPELLDDAPLIGAAWSMQGDQAGPAYDYLLAAAERQMIDWDRNIWLATANKLRGTKVFAALLGWAVRDPHLVAALRREFIVASDPAEPAVR